MVGKLLNTIESFLHVSSSGGVHKVMHKCCPKVNRSVGSDNGTNHATAESELKESIQGFDEVQIKLEEVNKGVTARVTEMPKMKTVEEEHSHWGICSQH